MRCYRCGYEAEHYSICPGCGSNLTTYKRIMDASALCYNEGLRKALVRDLSGAIDELTKSLKYNKYNIDARNLLGLIYYEIGEPVNAMAEWVISKNLAPKDNLADGYLKELQKDAATLNRMNDATKKYNHAIVLIRQGDFDLAKIQLKRLVAKNPNMIRARSLLALIYLKSDEPKAARKELVAAGKIDVGNPTINTYFQEVKEGIRGNETRRKRKKNDENRDEAVVYDDTSRFTYIMDYSKVTLVNVIIGTILGLLVSMFLIFPAIRQNSNHDAMSALITANEGARSDQNDMAAMRQTIDALNGRLETYEGKSDVKASYENLVSAISAANAGDMEGAAGFYRNVTKDVLDPIGQEAYEELASTVGGYMLNKSYENANSLKDSEDYQEAIRIYLEVIAEDEVYDEGGALYNLASCYESMGDNANAITYYNKVIEHFAGRRISKNAKARMDKLPQTEEELNNPEDEVTQ